MRISFTDHLTEILSSEDNMKRTVEQLSNILRTWKFDGWLVNVEVQLGVR